MGLGGVVVHGALLGGCAAGEGHVVVSAFKDTAAAAVSAHGERGRGGGILIALAAPGAVHPS